MRIGIILLCCVAFSLQAYSQNKSLGVGTTSPSPNAALHVESPTNNQGFLMPRLTTGQRLSFTPLPTDIGLMVVDITLESIQVWDGTRWVGLDKTLPETYDLTDTDMVNDDNALSIVYTGDLQKTLLNIDFAKEDNPNIINPVRITHRGQGAALNLQQTGTLGTGAIFSLSNPANPQSAVRGITFGSGAGIQGMNNGTGNGFAGVFSISEVTNTYPAIQANSKGTGSAIRAFQSETDGTGPGVDVFMLNTASTGNGISVDQQGLGNAGYLRVNNQTSNAYGLHVISNANSASGYFEQTNSGVWAPAIISRTDGLGAALAGTSTLNSTNANAAEFVVLNPSNPRFAIMAATEGTGAVIQATHNGASGNIAVFQSNNANVARIDKTGQGFFNGGTTNSGADLAELFEVEGVKNDYEPGDVLVISINTDRTVEKSNSANSTKVVGVYATKPGIILTEKSIDDNLDALIPMGVVGVIPTKVCLENGPIKRGDLLVTSSKKGHAMKAIPVVINGIEIYPSGAILGKALENFEVGESGLIQVFVNVK